MVSGDERFTGFPVQPAVSPSGPGIHRARIRGLFAWVDRSSVEQKIRQRIGAYEPEWKQQRLDPWVRDWLTPVLTRMELACVPWEEVLQNVRRHDPDHGAALQEFYERCLRFNGPTGPGVGGRWRPKPDKSL